MMEIGAERHGEDEMISLPLDTAALNQFGLILHDHQ
jgi:hypothetical protein